MINKTLLAIGGCLSASIVLYGVLGGAFSGFRLVQANSSGAIDEQLEVEGEEASEVEHVSSLSATEIREAADPISVPFYSQFSDISRSDWKKRGCGVASLAMLIELYRPGEVSVDKLLQEGIASGAYLNGAGWTHQGLVNLAGQYGLAGQARDLAYESTDTALIRLKEALKKGPVIASIHYKFDPQSTIPHLAVINDIIGETVYYNDPAEPIGGKSLSLVRFKEAWKKRYIAVYPPESLD